MKSNPNKLSVVSAVFAGLFTLTAQADDLGTDYLLDLEAKSILQTPKPAESRRLPAFTRISRGLAVHRREGSGVMHRRDEMTSNVMALHVICAPGGKLRAGHGLAPNLHRITRR